MNERRRTQVTRYHALRRASKARTGRCGLVRAPAAPLPHAIDDDSGRLFVEEERVVSPIWKDNNVADAQRSGFDAGHHGVVRRHDGGVRDVKLVGFLTKAPEKLALFV
jgi:hypothetical protein